MVNKPMSREEMEMDRQKLLKRLLTSYEMYEKTIQETKSNPKNMDKRTLEDNLTLIKGAQDDVVKAFLQNGGKQAELDEIVKRLDKKGNISDLLGKLNKKIRGKTVLERMKDVDVGFDVGVLPEKPVVMEENIIKPVIEKKITKQKPIEFEEVRSEIRELPTQTTEIGNVQYDVIPLPSKGECYKNKLGNLPVAYLTARDENMITSPNLYRDNLIFDYLLRAKIQNPNIDPDLLLPGDRDAIILWLRASGYGPEFPVSAVDPDSGVEFDAIVDLTTIKQKEFTLKGDENGYFDFELPVSKDLVKFRFLNNREEKKLEELNRLEDIKTKKAELLTIIGRLEDIIENSEIDFNTKKKLSQANAAYEEWISTIDDEEMLGYTNIVTNRLEMSIVSINGNINRDYIFEYVSNMNVKDSLELRKHITNNQPGLNYNIEIERPEGLGGGSVPIFLKLDETIFLNVS
jgi:hypothetical protein